MTKIILNYNELLEIGTTDTKYHLLLPLKIYLNNSPQLVLKNGDTIVYNTDIIGIITRLIDIITKLSINPVSLILFTIISVFK